MLSNLIDNDLEVTKYILKTKFFSFILNSFGEILIVNKENF